MGKDFCFMFFVAISFSSIVNSCDPGWTLIGQRCFRLFVQPHPWIQAQAICQSFGGNLASIHSTAENEAVAQLRPPEWHGWIGGIRIGEGIDFAWVDGSQMSYMNWAPDQPDYNEEREKCVELLANSWWNDFDCNNNYGFICAKNRFN